MVPELKKFKRETYILAQTGGQHDSSSAGGEGCLKVVPIFFRGVLPSTTFQRVFGQTSVFCAALQRLNDFRVKHSYGKWY